MQKHFFVLFFLLLLSERLPCYDSSSIMGDKEASGDELLLSTTTGTSESTSSIATSNQVDQATATAFTEIENVEVGNTTITETADMEHGDLHPALIFGVPAVLLVVMLILLVTFIVRRRNQKRPKQDELGSENCKSPIFEEDTPSVMEIEMEELDKWMNSLKQNAECEYLPPVKEEKDCNANLSDCES